MYEITIRIPDNLMNRDERVGAIVTAALRASGKVSITANKRPVEETGTDA
jgi:hypothetical protein